MYSRRRFVAPVGGAPIHSGGAEGTDMSPSDQGMRHRRRGGKLSENPYPESALEDSPYVLWRRGWMSLGTSYRMPTGRVRVPVAPAG